MVKLTVLTKAQSTESKASKHSDKALEKALEKRIIQLLKENDKINQKDIGDRLGCSRTSVQKAMKLLVEKGIIERKGGKRFGYWEIHE